MTPRMNAEIADYENICFSPRLICVNSPADFPFLASGIGLGCVCHFSS